MVNLHYLDLHSPPTSVEDECELFQMDWYLENDGPPEGAPPSDFCLEIGDLIAMEHLFTGAGEFEGLRAVGPKDADGRYLLLPMGVEYIEWPKEILDHVDDGTSLRERYEVPLNKVLDQCGGFTMNDLVDDIEEFWNTASISTGAHNHISKPDQGEWAITLSHCKWKPRLHTPEEEETLE